jgi:DNA/RNA endonuclease YhcR with UshA esterase domain
MSKQTIAQLLKHDFKSKGSLYLYDTNGNIIYCENSNGYWSKYEYDNNGNITYCEYSDGGTIIDKRPKKETCNGKVVEIDGKKYQLKELD